VPRRRVRAFPDLVHAASGQWGRLVVVVDALDDAAFAEPTRIGWTVAQLCAHIVRTVDAVSRALGEPAQPAQPAQPARPACTAEDYFVVARERYEAIDARARVEAAAQSPAQLRTALGGAVDRARADLDGRDGQTVVEAALGPIRLADFLETRCVEAVVHGLDLPGSARVDPDPQALRAAVRLLTDMLAARAPGRSVEVRVPPYAVVSCGVGPQHTRGTPPNVVEVPAVVFVELVSGRLDWAAALREGATASGARADLSRYLPLL